MSSPKKNILVVDDDALARARLRDVLEPTEFRVLEAEDGARALEIMSSVPLDLVLLDLVMPLISGLELLHHLHQQQNVPPFIVISSMGRGSVENEALRAGAVGFISKPFCDTDVVREVDHALHSW